MSFGDALARLLSGAGQTLMAYGQVTEARRRADVDDAFQQARIDQANNEMSQREQNRLRSEAMDIASGTSKSLENAGIYGTAPALAALAKTQGNRVQGQSGMQGAVGEYASSALGALHDASKGGISDSEVTDLGDGRYFVPPNLGRPERPPAYGPEWLAAMSALEGVRGDQRIRVNASKPRPASDAKSNDALLQAGIDRYVSESGGDSGKAMTMYCQQNPDACRQSTAEGAQAFSGLGTRFNASAQNYRNKTITGSADGKASVKGRVPLSAVSKDVRRQWAAEAGITPSNDPATVAKMLEWIKANHPEVDVTLK